MKKTIILILTLLLMVYTILIAQAPDWQWATQAGGISSDSGYGIAIDNSGNSYVTGMFHETASFGSTTLTSSGGGDIYVARLDADGNWEWATRAGGSSDDMG